MNRNLGLVPAEFSLLFPVLRYLFLFKITWVLETIQFFLEFIHISCSKVQKGEMRVCIWLLLIAIADRREDFLIYYYKFLVFDIYLQKG